MQWLILSPIESALQLSIGNRSKHMAQSTDENFRSLLRTTLVGANFFKFWMTFTDLEPELLRSDWRRYL